MIKRIVLIAVAALLVALGLGWWVVESSGVAIVETRTSDGGTRNTRVWYEHSGDAIWLEAAHPKSPWYLDIQRHPQLVFRPTEARGPGTEFAASTVPGKGAHDFVRGLFREKYGLRDEILGWVVDTSQSIAVRLTPIPSAGAR